VKLIQSLPASLNASVSVDGLLHWTRRVERTLAKQAHEKQAGKAAVSRRFSEPDC
jgi:hypothetical protein